jgi:PST family polysaccharide transporter
MIGLSSFISKVTFGNSDYTIDIAVLGIVILMSSVAGGEMALLQGLRKIGDMAKANIVGSVISTFVSIALYFFLGMRGIVPSLIAVSAVQLFIAWFYTRRIEYEKVDITWKESLLDSGNMVRLGFVFMWNNLVTSGINFITISLISQKLGIHSVGIYSAAFSLSGIFVNFILASMGTDYYPRLAGLSGDNEATNRQVNEQTEICLLLALPGLIATLTLAPWIVRLFYTSDFLPAVDLLRWFILGCFGRILSWPLGFLILALGKSRLILLNESFFNIFHLMMIAGGIYYFGLLGVALAFVIAYVGYTVSVFFISHRLTGFIWFKSTVSLLLYSSVLLVFAFICAELMPLWPATYFGLALTALSTVVGLRWLITIVGPEHRIAVLLLKVPGVAFFVK